MQPPQSQQRLKLDRARRLNGDLETRPMGLFLFNTATIFSFINILQVDVKLRVDLMSFLLLILNQQLSFFDSSGHLCRPHPSN